MQKKVKPQDIQDNIFRNMTADQKVELGSQLWHLAKSLVGDKINYAKSRSSSFTHKNRKNSVRT